MMETCQNISGMVDFAHELLPFLTRLDEYLLSFRSDLIPGHVTAQLGHVLVGYLAGRPSHLVLQPQALLPAQWPHRLVEKELSATGYPISGWARCIAIFVLREERTPRRQAQRPGLLGSVDQLKAVYPESGLGWCQTI